jgi:hypothetical protein
LPSSGLKSSENVTPVVGSAMRGGPAVVVDVFDVDDVLELPHAATATVNTAAPSRPVNALRVISS